MDNSFMDKTCMEILDLSGNSDMEILPISLSKASSLEMLVLDGCDGLENVAAPSRLPPSLKSLALMDMDQLLNGNKMSYLRNNSVRLAEQTIRTSEFPRSP